MISMLLNGGYMADDFVIGSILDRADFEKVLTF